MKYFLSFILFFTISKCQEIPFKVGELLKYSAHFELIPVGEAELFFTGSEKFNDVDVYHVSWKAYTKGLARTIFKIQDKIDIWIDKKDFFTHRLKSFHFPFLCNASRHKNRFRQIPIYKD